MGYESYESGEQYGPYEGGAEFGREEYPEQGYPEQGYAGHGHTGQEYPGQEYPGQYPEQYQQPYPEQERQGYPRQPQHQDAQWAQSGLGWERQAWDEARLGASPLQEQGFYEGQQGGYERPEQYEGSAGHYGEYEQYEQFQQYAQPYEQPQYEQQPHEQQSYEQQSYEQQQSYAEQPYAQYGQGYPQQQYEQQYEQPYEQHEQYEQYEAEPERESEAQPPDGYSPGVPHQRANGEVLPSADPDAAAAAPETAAPAPADKPTAKSSAESAAAPTQGRGAFGAAGIGVVAAVAALASAGALLVVIALVQAGVGYGWQNAMTQRENRRADKRAAVLSVLIGWAATAGAFRLSVNDDSIGLPATLGVGFLLLAADQLLRSRTFGAGERVAGLAVAVTGALFAVLPAGFVAAERTDSGLTAACALTAALGVLCCALLGRNPIRGILAALVLGVLAGAVAAQSFQAQGGLEAGALGGVVAALGAAAAVGVTDRVAAEGDARGSMRIVTQVLPLALAAMGALFAAAVYR